MDLVQELNRIKAANDIINKDSERLGLRTMQSAQIKVAPVPKAQPSLVEESLAQPLAEPETRDFKINLGQMMIVAGIVVSIIFAYALFYFVKNQDSKPSRLSARKFERARKNQPELVISSGNFGNADEAKKYMDRLSRKLGVELKILKNGSQYSIQIGPSYPSKEDAIVVFDELSRYSVRDLSLKLDTYK